VYFLPLAIWLAKYFCFDDFQDKFQNHSDTMLFLPTVSVAVVTVSSWQWLTARYQVSVSAYYHVTTTPTVRDYTVHTPYICTTHRHSLTSNLSPTVKDSVSAVTAGKPTTTNIVHSCLHDNYIRLIIGPNDTCRRLLSVGLFGGQSQTGELKLGFLRSTVLVFSSRYFKNNSMESFYTAFLKTVHR